jgi:hypothetical protein
LGLTRRSSWSKAVAPLSPKPLPSTCTEMVAGKVMRPCCPARNVSSCCGRRRVRIPALAYTQSWAAPHEGFPPWATKCIFSGLREGGGIPAMQRTHPHPRHDRDWKARGFPCRPGSTATPSLFCRGQKDSGQKNAPVYSEENSSDLFKRVYFSHTPLPKISCLLWRDTLRSWLSRECR